MFGWKLFNFVVAFFKVSRWGRKINCYFGLRKWTTAKNAVLLFVSFEKLSAVISHVVCLAYWSQSALSYPELLHWSCSTSSKGVRATNAIFNSSSSNPFPTVDIRRHRHTFDNRSKKRTKRKHIEEHEVNCDQKKESDNPYRTFWDTVLNSARLTSGVFGNLTGEAYVSKNRSWLFFAFRRLNSIVFRPQGGFFPNPLLRYATQVDIERLC